MKRLSLSAHEVRDWVQIYPERCWAYRKIMSTYQLPTECPSKWWASEEKFIYPL